MSFLSGLGKGLSRAFDGTNLAITQAILAGDYQGAAALRARQGELQRQLQQDSDQSDARDRQVIGAKNLGFNDDEIGAMGGPEFATAVRQQAMRRMFGPSGGAGVGEGMGGVPPTDGAPQPEPIYAPPPGAPPPGAQSAPALSAGSAQGPAAGNFPRVRTNAEAASLPRGSFFFAPDGSIRRIN